MDIKKFAAINLNRLNIRHVESGVKIADGNAPDAKEGHLYCT